MTDDQKAVLNELRECFPLVYWREPRDRMREFASFAFQRLDDTGEIIAGVPVSLASDFHTGEVSLMQAPEQAIAFVLSAVGLHHYRGPVLA